MDELPSDALSSILEHLSLRGLHRAAAVSQRWAVLTRFMVAEWAAFESSGAIVRADEGPMRNALRRPCFLALFQNAGCDMPSEMAATASSTVDDAGDDHLHHPTEFDDHLHHPTALLAVTNRWDIGRVHAVAVEGACVHRSFGSFGDGHSAAGADQELNEPRGVAACRRGSGALYVVDGQNARLRPLVEGSFREGWALVPSDKKRALGLEAQDVAVLPDGRLCVTRAFNVQRAAGGLGAGWLPAAKGHSLCIIFEPTAPAQVAAGRGGGGGALHFGRYGHGRGHLSQPRCCCGWAAEVFVADAALHRIAVYDATSGEPVRALGAEGAAPGRFRAPFGVAVAEGCLVVSEGAGQRVQVLTLLGEPLQVLPLGGALRGLSWDAGSGRLAVAAFESHRVELLRASASKLRRLMRKCRVVAE